MPERVRIHSVRELSPGELGAGDVEQVGITYSTANIPPRTVFVDREKDTPQERIRVIKQDLEAARAAGRDTLELA